MFPKAYIFYTVPNANLYLHVKTDKTSNVMLADYSWLYRYNSVTKEKTLIPGCCILDLNTNEVQIAVEDDTADIVTLWQLEARPCKPTNDGRKAPQLLATNADLTVW